VFLYDRIVLLAMTSFIICVKGNVAVISSIYSFLLKENIENNVFIPVKTDPS
jgi:hypothetical protein